MKKITIIILVIGVIMIFQGCSTMVQKPFEQEGVLLSQSELEELHSKKISYVIHTEVNLIEMEYYPDGSASCYIISCEKNYRGKYTIKNGKKCTAWGKGFAWFDSCEKIYKVGENKYCAVYDEGSSYDCFTLK